MAIFIKANPLFFFRKYWSKTPYISVGNKWRLNEGGALNVLDGVGELQLFLVGFTSRPCRWTSQLLFDLFICRSFKKILKYFFQQTEIHRSLKQISFLIQTDNTNCKTHLHKPGVTIHGEYIEKHHQSSPTASEDV